MAYNSFEDKFLHGVEERVAAEKEKKELEDAYARAQRILEQEAVDPRSFSDLYNTDMIERDLAYTDKLEKIFKSESGEAEKAAHKYATVLEGIVHEGIEKSGWLGEGAHAIKTSRFDDIVNGVDEVVEIKGKDETTPSRLALAVDVTFSNQIAKKFKKIRDEIDSGKLGGVKYFLSEASHQRGELAHIPRVVVGTEISNVKKIQESWTKEEDFTRHPFHLLMLDEMSKQLDVFGAYAAHKRKDNIADAYRSAARTVKMIYWKKIRDEGMSPGAWEDDRVFAAIKKHLEDLA